MTHTKQPIQQPTCVAALQMFLFCWVLYYLPHMPPGLYLWWRQSLWLGLQFQSCKSNECLSENITKRLTPLQLNAICGLISFFVDPLTPWSTALWIQLVLLWSQLHPQQPCGEHNHPACQLTFHTYTPTINTPSPGPDSPFLIPVVEILVKSGNNHFSLQLCCYNFVVFDVPTVASFVILVLIAQN